MLALVINGFNLAKSHITNCSTHNKSTTTTAWERIYYAFFNFTVLIRLAIIAVTVIRAVILIMNSTIYPVTVIFNSGC